MFKKRVALLLAGMMFLMAGCGNAATGTESAPQEAVTMESGTESAAASSTESTSAGNNGETITLTIATPTNTNLIDFDTNYMTKRIEEKFNVDIQMMELPTGEDLKQKLSLMVSSGEKLPDIIMYNWMSVDETYMYGSAGAYIPLNDYFADETLSPNFHKYVSEEDQEIMLKSFTSADGNIYGTGRFSPEAGNNYAWRAWINQTWLDNLGLEMPKTTEDFYNVLKAFKEQDPNGNGKADEIPMTGSPTGWNTNPIPWIMNAFVYTDAGRDYFYVEDGKITPSFTQEGWKEGLTYINRLVSEELLSPMAFTQDWNQVKTLAENEEAAVIGSVVAGIPPYTAGSERYEEIDVLPPLTGPDGTCWATYIADPAYLTWVITRDCEYPELAFQIADYGFDPEMSMVSRYGEPGVNWDTNVEGLVCPYEESLGIEPGFRELENCFGVPQNSRWPDGYPAYRPLMSSMSVQGLAVDPETTSRFNILMPKSVGFYQDKHPEEVIVSYLNTAEETEELTTLKTDINTYVKESMVRFATGEMPLTEWDNYIQTLNDMGLDRYIELLQAGYDRYNEQ